MAYRLENGEPLPDGIRRIATEQLSSAIKHLQGETGARDTHVHKARKNMKRLRGLIRLLRFELGKEAFGRENACDRLAAAEQAGMRDATVLIETLDKLVRTADRPMRRDRFRNKGGDKVDAVVRGRKVVYRLGPAVDSSGKFLDGTRYQDFRAYRDYLAKHDDRLARAFAAKLLTFATGRELGFSDRAELDRIVADTAKNKHRLRDLLHRIIQSEIFLNK